MTEQTTRLAMQQAAQWVLRIDIEQSTDPEDYMAFIEWIKLAPEHDQYYEDCKAAWQTTGQLPHSEEDKQLAPPPVNRRSRPVWLSACASIILAVGLMLWMLPSESPQYAPYLVTSKVGELRTVQLADGSKLTLNTDTTVSVNFSDKQRLLELERGEILVDVTKQADWPFVVSTEFGEVEALGTRFSLRAEAKLARVELLEGHLRVSQAAKGRILGDMYAGDGLKLSSSPMFEKYPLANITDQPDWVLGKLSFNDIPLSELVAEVNRYLPRKLHLVTPDLQQLRVSAVFEIDKVDSLLSALQKSFQLNIHQTETGIYLSR